MFSIYAGPRRIQAKGQRGEMNTGMRILPGRPRAQAMVIVFVYLVIIFLVAIALNIYAQNLHRLVIRHMNHMRALNAAETGMIAKLNHMATTWFDTGTPNTSPLSMNFPTNHPPPHGVDVTIDNLTGGNYRVHAEVSGWHPGAPAVNIATNFPSPLGEYARLVLNGRLYDYHDPDFWVDLRGHSVLNHMVDTETLAMERAGQGALIYGNTGGAQRQYIDLNRYAEYSMVIHSLYVHGMIHMGAPDPSLINPAAGKLIYDIAEGVAAPDCEPGDVVRVSGRGDMSFERSVQAYDSRVAGIISASPAFLMGGEPGTMPLALNGIVACKVVTENGPIERGDLLVSSSRPGYAMRAAPESVRPGMLVGKALQPLTDGDGMIYVLVNKR